MYLCIHDMCLYNISAESEIKTSLSPNNFPIPLISLYDQS